MQNKSPPLTAFFLILHSAFSPGVVVPDLLHMALTNALTAAALAVVVAAVTFPLRRKRPAAVHALWLLVLLKLLTPPLWSLPVSLPVAASPTAPAPAPTRTLTLADLPEDVEFVFESTPAQEPAPAPAANPSVNGVQVATTAALSLWAAGSVACVALLLVRSVRFRRLLRHASPVPADVRFRAARLARQLGLRKLPSVEFIPGAVCPMLWSFAGRARLLLPEQLWARLDDAQRDTLIAHELAHLRRRDDLVRLIEVAATVLYWWNPVLWWARRGLREAEEQCCDAWVVWSLPASVRHYMTAILEAVEFVSEPDRDKGFAPPALPALASGMGEFRRLERRLWMIRKNESPRRLGRAGLAAVVLAAAVALPLAPSLADDTRELVVTTTSEDTQPVTSAATSVEAEDVIRVGIEPVTTSLVVSGDVLAMTSAAAAAEDGKTITVTEGDTLTTIDAATGKIISKSHGVKTKGGGADNDAELNQARAEVEKLSAALEQAHARLAKLEKQRGGKPTAVRLKTTKGWEGGDKAGWKVETATKWAKSAEKDPKSAVSFKKADITTKAEERDASDERLDELEQKLEKIDALLSEIREQQGKLKDKGSKKDASPKPL